MKNIMLSGKNETLFMQWYNQLTHINDNNIPDEHV